MNTLTILTAAGVALIGIGIAAVVFNLYRLLVVWAEDRAREKRYADQYRRTHPVGRRRAGE